MIREIIKGVSIAAFAGVGGMIGGAYSDEATFFLKGATVCTFTGEKSSSAKRIPFLRDLRISLPVFSERVVVQLKNDEDEMDSYTFEAGKSLVHEFKDHGANRIILSAVDKDARVPVILEYKNIIGGYSYFLSDCN